ncbi:MAG: arginine--tRNA ligase [Eubacteriales bacterium]|nr:arginine--tRNA ligase [Eubacteriales bacterium]
MHNLKNNIAAVLNLSIGIDTHELASMIEYPPDSKLGDLSLPCFKLSRRLKAAPPSIAASLAAGFECEGIDHVETAGGYLNFYIDKNYLAGNVLDKIIKQGESYGSSDMGKGKTVVLDYSSPNVAKPFHIGHLGTTVIGHSLRMLHEFAGFKCVSINHLGDWGTQFGKLIVAYRKWGSAQDIETGGIDALVALYVRFHEESQKNKSLEDEARTEFTKLEHGDQSNTALWKWFIEISITEYQKTYKQLGIEFDSYKGESFYTDKMPEQIEILREKGLLKTDNGASLVNLEQFNMAPCLILKSDGSTLYPTRDIAAAVYRKRTYNFDKAIYVTSAGQSLHFAQWFKVVELMGYQWADQLVHIPYGTVSIDGSKLATRTGNVILLRDLFAMAIDKVSEIMEEKNAELQNREEVAEAVGVGAIVFHYLYNSRIKDINFVLDDALNFDGNTGPYAQYTYARACSILQKGGEYGDGAKITADEETALLKILSLFPERVESAISEYEPYIITRYIIDVCTAFNRFYHDCPILSAKDGDIRSFRIKLTAAVKHVLGNAFNLICMRKTDRI